MIINLLLGMLGLFGGVCLVLAAMALAIRTVGLSVPVLDGLVGVLDNLRKVLLAAAMDVVQVSSASDQAVIDAERERFKLEAQIEVVEIQTSVLRKAASHDQDSPDLGAFRMAEVLGNEWSKK